MIGDQFLPRIQVVENQQFTLSLIFTMSHRSVDVIITPAIDTIGNYPFAFQAVRNSRFSKIQVNYESC